jgi:hypothetical protein
MYSWQISSLRPNSFSVSLKSPSPKSRIQHPTRTCHHRLCCCILDNRPATTILHPHSRYFLSTAPSIHLKNHDPHIDPAKFWRGYPCQIALATLQPQFDRLDLQVSSPLPQYPRLRCINIPAAFDTSHNPPRTPPARHHSTQTPPGLEPHR